ALLKTLLGNPQAAYAATAAGRGVLLRLLIGETLPVLLRDDDLILAVSLAAPGGCGDRGGGQSRVRQRGTSSWSARSPRSWLVGGTVPSWVTSMSWPPPSTAAASCNRSPSPQTVCSSVVRAGWRRSRSSAGRPPTSG